MHGIDAVKENIKVASELHTEIAERTQVADLQRPIPFADEYFDFVICTSVIQHLLPDVVTLVTLQEFARVLKPGGVLQLLFKNGQGVETVYDQEKLLLNSGDQLFLYTDGVIEAPNDRSVLFGREHLLDSLNEAGDVSIKILKDRVLNAVRAHTGGSLKHDDLTILIIEVN